MKSLLMSALVAAVALAALVPSAEAHPHRACRFDHHHHRVCHWVR
ncbi:MULTISPECIES: HHHH-motif protein [Burkholderia]|nr:MULTISPECIES: HHHH-motif protein [Burkholderia]